MNAVLVDFVSPCRKFRIAFDDNGKVAYAYLKTQNAVVGDVWLYNRGTTPSVPEWGDRNKAPFANPRGYAGKGGLLRRKVCEDDVSVEWYYEDDETTPVAYIYVFQDLYGVVGVGDKPGYARHALKNGPLAKVMDIDWDK